MFYGRSHLHKHPHSFEKHRPDPVGLVPVGERSFLEYSVRPNIDGQSHIAGYFAPNLSAEGAFGTSTRWTSSISLGSGNNAAVINFDASLSNPIFGASDTVQTSSMRGLCLIRAYQS